MYESYEKPVKSDPVTFAKPTHPILLLFAPTAEMNSPSGLAKPPYQLIRVPA